MDKKIFLIAFIALMLSMSVVSATTYKNEKFDGFSIEVPKNSHFVKQAIDEEGGPELGDNKLYADDKMMVAIEYIKSPMVSEENADFFYQAILQNMNPDLNSCWETQKGNMKLLSPMKSSENSLAMACITEGNQTVVVYGVDEHMVEHMGSTVEFN